LLLEALSFVVDFHRDDTVLEFLAVRRILEPAATAMAALRIPAVELDALASGSTRWVHSRRWRNWSPPTWSSTGHCAGFGELGALLFARRVVRADHAGADLARADPGGRGEPDAVGAPGDSGGFADRDAEAARSWAIVHVASVEQWLRSTL